MAKHYSMQSVLNFGVVRRRSVKRAKRMAKSPIKLPLDVASDTPVLVWMLTKQPQAVATMVEGGGL